MVSQSYVDYGYAGSESSGRIRLDFEPNRLQTAEIGKMPAGVFDDRPVGVGADFVRRCALVEPLDITGTVVRNIVQSVAEIPAAKHSRSPPVRPSNVEMVQVVTMVKLLENRNAGIVFMSQNRFGPRNLVQVGYENHVVVLAIGQPTINGVSLEIFECPRIIEFGKIVDDDMRDPIQKRGETFLVFLEMERLGQVGKCSCGLDEHKTIHNVLQDVQPNVQQVEFVEESKAVVDHFRGRAAHLVTSCLKLCPNSMHFDKNYGVSNSSSTMFELV